MSDIVDNKIWIISEDVALDRRARLEAPISHEELITKLKTDLQNAIEHGNFSASWKQGINNKAFWRFEGMFLLQPETFDLLFNARNGYRAQYYLDLAQGRLFNNRIIIELIPCIKEVQNLPEPRDAVLKSLEGPYSKTWTGGEGRTVIWWIREHLLKTLAKPSVIVMDNAPFHPRNKIRTVLEEHGHKLLCLPKYSPDLNPIENTFAAIKINWRHAAKQIPLDTIITSNC